MFGSRREPELMDGRKIIWDCASLGVPLQQVISELVEVARRYESDADDLRFGYWEYGDQIVVTASSEKDRAANDSRNAEEVSPEMLNAGWSAFYKFADDRSGPNNETIIAVYLAMRRVSRQQKGDKE